MSEKKKFNNLDEAIDYIIDQLSDSERELIKNGDPAGLHMGLAGWVSKEFVYNEKLNITELVIDQIKNKDPYYRENQDKPLHIHPDNITGLVIDELISKLNNAD